MSLPTLAPAHYLALPGARIVRFPCSACRYDRERAICPECDGLLPHHCFIQRGRLPQTAFLIVHGLHMRVEFPDNTQTTPAPAPKKGQE